MGRTQEQRRAETRALLLAAAADQFANKGFHATSAEAVATAADRTTGALYDHFGGKEGLLIGLLEQWIEQTISDLTRSLEGETDLDGRLGALWAGLIRRDSESGDAWLLLEFELWLHAVRDPEIGTVGAERFRMMRAGLAGGLEDWSEEFGFELPGPALDIAAQVLGLLVGAAFQYRIDPTAFPQPVVVAGLRRLLGLPSADGATLSRSSAPTSKPRIQAGATP
ncbi:TetR/AcrR family transcriptional regulator [Aquihabitans sp. McL0605]|uniref:TetR/AcrR family transcriptional regulator n=1 Tax=Aquihabitans sp. McL0605 TaxID=3415671 RepID=UPI003CEE7226